MVCFSIKKNPQYGDGIIDVLKSNFTDEVFPGEMHMKGSHYTWPHTRLDIRTSGYPDYIPNGEIGKPVSKLDAISRDHDIAYEKINHDYLEHGDKASHLRQIHDADDKFINDAKPEGKTLRVRLPLI